MEITLQRRGPRLASIAGAVGLVLALILSSCSSGNGTGVRTVKIGIVDPNEDSWGVLIDKARAEGIKVETVKFSDYNQPNPALSQKQIDLNAFQHIRHLANYNVASNDTLVPIGATIIGNLKLYSTKHRSVREIPQGGTITMSNNPANQVRGLLLLNEAGLIKLRGAASWNVKLEDVDTAASKVRIVTLDPTQSAASLTSADAAFVDPTWAKNAKLTASDVLYSDKAEGEPYLQYVNVFAARAEDKDDPDFAKIVALFHDPEFEKARAKESPEETFRTDSVESLTATLKKLENDFRANPN